MSLMPLPRILPALLAILSLVPSNAVAAEEPGIYFGNLHAHSRLSDGHLSITPEAAYDYARDEGQLDFLCLSEHNHMLSKGEMLELQQAARAKTTSGFIALFGQEYSTIDKGFNHANIANYPEVIPVSLNGRYGEVFTQLLPRFSGAPVWAEFNHPESAARDYGFASSFGGDWAAFIAAMDPYVRFVAIGNGPADSDEAGKAKTLTRAEYFRHVSISTGDLNTWLNYVAHGLHVAPKIDHDSHSLTYGTRNAGRTAVYVPGAYTKDALIAALRGRHAYATEDRDLKAWVSANGEHLPGSFLPTMRSAQLSIRLEDPSEPGAKYTVEFLTGETGSGQPAVPVRAEGGELRPGAPVRYTVPLPNAARAYLIVHIAQFSKDPEAGCTRDNAWFAPFWFGEAEGDAPVPVLPVAEPAPRTLPAPDASAAYVGSKNSEAVHYPGCADAARIKPANFVTYTKIPPGKHLHAGCPR